MKNFWRAFIFVIIAEAVGIIGSLFTAGNISGWYLTLHKPSFSPPNWLFGPVWTILYALMGIAAYMVWKKGRPARKALSFYWAQLALNGLWTPMFFGAHNIGGALRILFALIALVVITMRFFWKIDRWAVYLLVAYLAWIIFAAFLNYSLFRLN
jgi:tryptophan-rich sensory protein